MPEHIGYELWTTQNPAHPYPISDIDVKEATEHYIAGEVDIAFPAKIPKKNRSRARRRDKRNRGNDLRHSLRGAAEWPDHL